MKLPNLREKCIFHERLGRGGAGNVYRITVGGLSCALKKINIGQMSDEQKQVQFKFIFPYCSLPLKFQMTVRIARSPSHGNAQS
jgi:hypothetical protein